MTTTSETKSIVKQALTDEVKFIISIVVFVAGVVAPYYNVQKDIALIQKDINIINTNHLAHTEDLAQDLKDIAITQKDQQSQIIELQKQIVALISRGN